MRTSWSEDYINRVWKGDATNWLNSQRLTFERRTDVKWSWWRAHGRYVFSPDWRTLYELRDETRAIILIDHVLSEIEHRDDCVSFLKIFSRVEHIMSLSEVIRLCRWLVRCEMMVVAVGRTGYANSVRVRRDYLTKEFKRS
jgi:hypothetical protein